ncbi:hypothetical protein Y695_03400 [Hydrogenophaga sp. T4]|nr:hypothetical protein Y695_03400 [Hydrogenophaga sp. T4]
MDHLQPVAHGEAVLGLHLGPAVFAHLQHLAHELAAVAFAVAGDVVLVVLRRAALHQAAGVAAVGQAFQLQQQLGVEGLAGHGVVDGAAVDLRGARHVVVALGAAFDLERVDAHGRQLAHVFDGAQVFAIHDVGAVLVFHDRHELARAAGFFDQPDLVGLGVALAVAHGREGARGFFVFLREIEAIELGQRHGFARVGLGGRGLGLVLPAAGVGAGALVGVAAVEVAAQQAATRVGDAQRAVHEDFELDVGAVVADRGHLIKAQLAAQDDAGHALLLPELHRRAVGGVGLHREVDRHLGPEAFVHLLAHQHDQAGVGHDERVGLEFDHRLQVAKVGAQLVVVRDQVAGDEEFFAACMGFFDALRDLFHAELVVARAQAVARLAGVDASAPKS